MLEASLVKCAQAKNALTAKKGTLSHVEEQSLSLVVAFSESAWALHPPNLEKATVGETTKNVNFLELNGHTLPGKHQAKICSKLALQYFSDKDRESWLLCLDPRPKRTSGP